MKRFTIEIINGFVDIINLNNSLPPGSMLEDPIQR